jgi:hypothetical protein
LGVFATWGVHAPAGGGGRCPGHPRMALRHGFTSLKVSKNMAPFGKSRKEEVCIFI